MNTAWPKKICALLCVVMLLTGCVTARSDNAAYWGAVARTAGTTVAPAVRAYTASEQAKARAELATLPADSIVAGVMMPDYLRMRDQARELAR